MQFVITIVSRTSRFFHPLTDVLEEVAGGGEAEVEEEVH